MCGRFTLRTPIRDVADLFDLLPGDMAEALAEPPRYNIAPTQEILAVRHRRDAPGRELVRLRWGLVPSWADAPGGNLLINARAESVASKPAFRDALRKRRCLIPADGFYEWRRKDRAKQPYYIRRKDERPFAFAGLWEHWRRGEQSIDSCTIITTEANALVRPLHDRMPAILDVEAFERWLDPAASDPDRLLPLVEPYAAERMTAFPVAAAVNRAGFEDPQCIEPAAPAKTQGSLFD